jgi:hypothetical protein
MLALSRSAQVAEGFNPAQRPDGIKVLRFGIGRSQAFLGDDQNALSRDQALRLTNGL